MESENLPLSPEHIEEIILLVRGQRVMLDADLAALYRVETRALKQAVRRNRDRFPEDFMFELSREESKALQEGMAASKKDRSRSQTVILNRGENIKYAPFVFTEQGVAMLSSVLRSKRAVQVNVEIMRAFVRLRQIIRSNSELARQLADLEKKYDQQFRVVFQAIRQLMNPPRRENPRKIGFKMRDDGESEVKEKAFG